MYEYVWSINELCWYVQITCWNSSCPWRCLWWVRCGGYPHQTRKLWRAERKEAQRLGEGRRCYTMLHWLRERIPPFISFYNLLYSLIFGLYLLWIQSYEFRPEFMIIVLPPSQSLHSLPIAASPMKQEMAKQHKDFEKLQKQAGDTGIAPWQHPLTWQWPWQNGKTRENDVPIQMPSFGADRKNGSIRGRNHL